VVAPARRRRDHDGDPRPRKTGGTPRAAVSEPAMTTPTWWAVRNNSRIVPDTP